MPVKLQHQLKQNLIWRGLYFALSFITTVCISRILKAEANGDYSYFLTVLSLIVLIVSFNVESAFTYYLSAKIISLKKLIVIALSIFIFIYALVYFIFKSAYYDQQLISISNLQINVYQCSINYFSGIVLLNFATALLYGMQNFKTSNYVLCFSSVVFLVLIGYRFYFNHHPFLVVADFCLMILITGILMFVILIVQYKAYKNISLPSINDYKNVYSYATIIMLSNLVFFFVYKLDYNFVKNWCNSSTDLGNYLQASKFSQILLVVPQILASTIFPLVAKQNQKEEIMVIIGRLVRLFSTLFFVLFIVFAIIGKWFFPLLFGITFNKMYVPTIILIPGVYFLATSSLFSAYFAGTKKNRINLYGAIVAIFVMVGLSFACKTFYSIKIAAAISLIAYATEAIYVAFNYYKIEGKFSFKNVLLFTKDDYTWLKETFR